MESPVMGPKDGDGRDFPEHYTVCAHGTTDLTVVHTNVPEEAKKVLDMYSQWLQEPGQTYKIVGLDVEYTLKEGGKPQGAALVQLCMRQHCLLYHVCRVKAPRYCSRLKEFLQNRDIEFASVDIRNDSKVLESICIHVANHADLQMEFQI